MVRLVFRPYTQISRSICTSESFRASTRVSSAFTLFRHSSPSFGYHHVCCSQHLFKQDSDDGFSLLQTCPPCSLSLRIMVCNTIILTYMLDSLVRVSRRDVYLFLLWYHMFFPSLETTAGVLFINTLTPIASFHSIFTKKHDQSSCPCAHRHLVPDNDAKHKQTTPQTYTSLSTVSGTF